jgi:MFS family permease
MIVIAQGWPVLELTDSAFWVATASSAVAVPSLIFGPIAGVVADRLYRKTLLIVTRTIISVLGLIEGALILGDLIELGQILVLGFLTGIAYAIDIPARQSLSPDTVPEKVVSSGVAINVAVFSLAAISGPIAGAATLATVGAGGCFLANAVENMVLVAASAAIHIPRYQRTVRWDVIGDFVSALRFVRSSPAVLLLLLISLLTMIGTAPWRELASVFVRDVFNAAEAALGALFTASGVGSVIGAAILLTLARTERRSHRSSSSSAPPRSSEAASCRSGCRSGACSPSASCSPAPSPNSSLPAPP